MILVSLLQENVALATNLVGTEPLGVLSSKQVALFRISLDKWDKNVVVDVWSILSGLRIMVVPEVTSCGFWPLLSWFPGLC